MSAPARALARSGPPEPGPAATGQPAPAMRLYRIPEAVRLLGLSRTVVYELIRAGRLRAVRQGRARLIPASAIAGYIALLEREAEATP